MISPPLSTENARRLKEKSRMAWKSQNSITYHDSPGANTFCYSTSNFLDSTKVENSSGQLICFLHIKINKFSALNPLVVNGSGFFESVGEEKKNGFCKIEYFVFVGRYCLSRGYCFLVSESIPLHIKYSGHVTYVFLSASTNLAMYPTVHLNLLD